MRFAYPLSISTPSAMNHIRSSKCTNIIFIIFRTGTENFAVSLLLAAEINFPTHPQPGISTVPYGPARPGTARLGPGPLRPDLTCNGKETHGLFAHTHVFCTHGLFAHTHVFCTPPRTARPGPARLGTARTRPAQASVALTHRVSHSRLKGLAGPIRLPLRLAQTRSGSQDPRPQHAPARHGQSLLTRITHCSRG
jgi:hypothetical protein